jgi:type I restriction enzyme S subunit
MSKQEKKSLVPELRFPEFRDTGEWTVKPFEEVFKRLTTKNAENNQNALTISAQQGLVSQLEYFNKQVAAKDLSGYYLLHKGDFAYNKSYSQGYPMGAIKPLKLYDKGVVSTLYICFRTKKGFSCSFFEHYFETGLINPEIGKIAQEGGRAHGLLNVSVTEFFKDVNLPVTDPKEQQKIADCLTSIDKLITAQTQKLDTLKTHKKGLMQQLFPAEGETVPKLRFPEFRDTGEWMEYQLGQCLSRHPEYGINAPAVPYSDKLPRYLRITDISEDGEIRQDQKVSVGKGVIDENYLDEGDVVLARTGASVGKAYKYRLKDGKLVFAGFLIRVKPDVKKLNSELLFQFLSTEQYWHWVNLTSARSGQPGINGNEYSLLPIPLPPTLNEQQKIADCLASVDELITVQTQKVDALKAYKKGLMQQLFPVMGEVNS